MPVAFFLPMIAQEAHPFSNAGIICRDDPTFAGRDVLGGIEREAARPETSHWLSVYLRCMRLTGIFNESNVMCLRQWYQSSHITGVTIQVHRHDRFCPRCESSFHEEGIERIRVRFNINEHGSSPNKQNDVGRCSKTERRRDHFITGTNIMCQQSEMQSSRP